MTLIQALLAFFLPPVSVFLQKGFGTQFILNCLLALFFVIPASIHAFWLLLSEKA